MDVQGVNSGSGVANVAANGAQAPASSQQTKVFATADSIVQMLRERGVTATLVGDSTTERATFSVSLKVDQTALEAKERSEAVRSALGTIGNGILVVGAMGLGAACMFTYIVIKVIP